MLRMPGAGDDDSLIYRSQKAIAKDNVFSKFSIFENLFKSGKDRLSRRKSAIAQFKRIHATLQYAGKRRIWFNNFFRSD